VSNSVFGIGLFVVIAVAAVAMTTNVIPIAIIKNFFFILMRMIFSLKNLTVTQSLNLHKYLGNGKYRKGSK
jgi:hypothetical protein